MDDIRHIAISLKITVLVSICLIYPIFKSFFYYDEEEVEEEAEEEAEEEDAEEEEVEEDGKNKLIDDSNIAFSSSYVWMISIVMQTHVF